MAVLFRLWKPATSGEDRAQLVAEIMKTLSVYGYGALPSDTLQAKMKVDGFCEVLEECPLWAVQHAGLKWRKTEKEAPTPQQWLSNSKAEMGRFNKVKFGDNTETVGRVYDKLVAWIKEQPIESIKK